MLFGFVQRIVSAVRQDGVLKGIRGFVNFTGAGVSVIDDPANNEVEVNIPGGGGGGGHTIKDEGTPLTARAGLNFVGGGVTATDDAVNNETDVTIPFQDHANLTNVLPNQHHNQVHTIDGTDHTGTITATQHGSLGTGADHTTAQPVQVRDEGTNIGLRKNINFVGAGVTVTDDAVNSEVDVTIPGSGGGTGTIHLPVGGAVLSDGSASNATPALQRVKSSAASPTPHFLQFAADAATDEHWQHQFRLNSDYSSTPVLKLLAKMASAVTGNVIIQCRIAAVTPGDATDVDAKAYGTVNTSSATAVPGTAGHLFEISLSLTNNDSMAAGDLIIIQINRDADNASDTATGDMEIVAASLEYTKV